MKKYMPYPDLYFGPMSKNIIDAVIAASNETYLTIGLIASRRQVDYHGGYVCGWTTSMLYDYVNNQGEYVFLCRDHGGPGQSGAELHCEDGGRTSLKNDVRYMDLIHIDPWKFVGDEDFKAGIEHTISLLKYCYELNPNVDYEIGTEAAIFPYTPEQLDELIRVVKTKVKADLFSNIKFACIQSGVGLDLLERKNVGIFNRETFDDFIAICDEYNLMSKEHNGDYLSRADITMRFEGGLIGINIAPELAQIESEYIWNQLVIKEQYELLHEFFILTKDYASWRKWIGMDYHLTEVDKKKFSIAFGHYIFNLERFHKLKEKAEINDNNIKLILKEYILDIYEATGKRDNRLGFG